MVIKIKVENAVRTEYCIVERENVYFGVDGNIWPKLDTLFKLFILY